MRTAAIIQARMSSTRLPGKVLAEAAGKPLLQHMIERLKRCKLLDDIVVATTLNPADDPIAALAWSLCRCYRGREEDVLHRVLQTARVYGAELIVELTGDCPLIDPQIVDRVIARFHAPAPIVDDGTLLRWTKPMQARIQDDCDYCSNILERTYPRGMDVQVFPASVLRETAGLTNDPADREHVSLYIYEHPERYRLRNVAATYELTDPDLRLTVDTPEDLALVSAIFETFAPRNDFSLGEILALLRERPELREINVHVEQKEVR